MRDIISVISSCQWKRGIFGILLVLLFASRAHAICAGSSPNLVAPTWADVAACHTAAASGDTITVTTGTYSASAQTVITKYVTIQASGSVTVTDNTCVGVDTSGSGSVIDIYESTAGNTKLDGFSIVPGTCFYHGSVSAVIRGFYTGGGKPILIHSNSYVTPYSNGDFISWFSNRGVIWGNTETGGYYDGGGTNCTSNTSFIRQRPTALDATWPAAANFGNADTNGDQALYVEGNTLNGIPEGIDQLQSARMVIRYNTFVNSAFIAHDGTDPGPRFAEIYNNTFWHDPTLRADCDGDKPAIINNFIAFRDGTGFVIGNVVPAITGYWGTSTPISFMIESLRRGHGPFGCWTGGYPIPYNVGWGWTSGGTVIFANGHNIAQDLQPIYFANNTPGIHSDGTGNYDSVLVQDYVPGPEPCTPTGPAGSTFMQPDREFYNQVALGSFTGTSGASQGVRASRPASTTNGVAYWSTDQGGNWDTTHGGANDGCLDKVVSGAWVNCWYTPAAYPNVIVTGSSSSASGHAGRIRVRK